MSEELIIYNRPKANISEDIRTIRTNLQFTASTDEAKVILVTSSIPGEGKSFISSNLAASFAQMGESTLLIDGDLRLGRVHQIFGLSNKKGLSNLLVDKEADCGDYIKKTEVKNLYVLPRGTVPPNPSELLNSQNAKNMVKILKNSFDHVIFDGVPVNGLPDALVMAGLVDRVIIVAASGYTNIDDLNETKKALQMVDANIAGVVVNRTARVKRGKYSHYYYYSE